jgi:hypothetical protein
MRKKLSNQRAPVKLRLCKQQNSGGKAINPVYDQYSLPPVLQIVTQQRQGGWRIRAGRRHSQKARRFIDRHHRIIFVQNGKFPRKTISLGRAITAAVVASRFFHGGRPTD